MTATLTPPAVRTPAAAQVPRLRPSRGLRTDVVFIRRGLLHSLRDPEALIMAIALPAILMLMFTFVFGGAIEGSTPGADYVAYIVPGIILLCAGFGAAGTAVGVNRDMTLGIVDRFRTMPIRASAVLTGHVVVSVGRNLVATAVVVGLGLALGWRPEADLVAWIGAVGLVALYILVITVLFAAIGLAAGSPEAANGYGFILLFLPYVSSAFVPVATMPEWLQWIAENQPITPIIETLRGLLMGTPLDDSPAWALGWCALILVAAVVWIALLFPRRRARR